MLPALQLFSIRTIKFLSYIYVKTIFSISSDYFPESNVNHFAHQIVPIFIYKVVHIFIHQVVHIFQVYPLGGGFT